MKEGRPQPAEGERGERLQLPFLLTTNSTVNALAERISSVSPDWEMIRLDGGRFGRPQTGGYFAEIHVGHVIERAVGVDPVLRERLIRNPVL